MYPTATMKPGPEKASSLRQNPAEDGTVTVRCDSGRLDATRAWRQPWSEVLAAVVESLMNRWKRHLGRGSLRTRATLRPFRGRKGRHICRRQKLDSSPSRVHVFVRRIKLGKPNIQHSPP